MSEIKTFEDACKYRGYDPANVLPDVSGMPEDHQEAIVAHAKLVIIAEALNAEANGGKKWLPDWTNKKWDKYYPWFDLSSGSGLSYDDYDYLHSDSTVCSRLCFKSAELAEYAGKQFIGLYEKYFLLK